MRDPWRDVGHLELYDPKAVVLAILSEQHVFRLTEAPTVDRCLREVNGTRLKLTLHKVLKTVPQVQQLKTVKVRPDSTVTRWLHPLSGRSGGETYTDLSNSVLQRDISILQLPDSRWFGLAHISQQQFRQYCKSRSLSPGYHPRRRTSLNTALSRWRQASRWERSFFQNVENTCRQIAGQVVRRFRTP